MFILPIIHSLLFAAYSWALGINCRGIPDCTAFRNSAKAQGSVPANEINTSIQSMSDEAFYMDQQPIACYSTEVEVALGKYVPQKICAFMSGTKGSIGVAIKELARQIVDHGCEACGSNPVDGRDVTNGALMFMLGDASITCSGLCPSDNGY